MPEQIEEDETHLEIPYNPVSNSIKDLSLTFDGDEMIVSTTFPFALPAVDDKGEPKVDAFGLKRYVTRWARYTATSAGELFGPGDELPERLVPYKPFALEGLIAGQTRFSSEGLSAFGNSEPPPDDLADQLKAAIGRRVAFQRPVHLPMVLVYVVLTYLFPLVRRVPFLAIVSRVPASGKTTLLELLEGLVFNGHRMGASSLAVIVRLASLARCTLLMDEQEKLALPEQAGDLIEVLNSRADAGSNYRNLGPEGQPRSFELFGPTVISNLGGLPPTIRSRSLVIEMAPSTDAASLRPQAADENLQAIRDGLLRWTRDNWQAVSDSLGDEAMNVGTNRHADLWRLPLAVAWHLGGQEMYEALYEEAAATATTAGKDEIQDAMAVAIANTIAEQVGVARRTGNKFGAFDVALKYLVGKAHEALEEDQHHHVHSKRMKAFAEAMGLRVDRSGKHKGSNAVFVAHPAATIARIGTLFPHLQALLPQLPPSAP